MGAVRAWPCHDGIMNASVESPAPLQITTAGGAETLRSLMAWLQQEDELRGRLRPASSSDAAEGTMGAGVFDVLTVALGSGGAGAVFARSLSAWLVNRRTDVRVTVERAGGDKVVVDLRRSRDDLPELIREIRGLIDGPQERG